ncbi:MAG: FG-GAP-like repeat-containing protein, partial [Chloroflexota bacterium]
TLTVNVPAGVHAYYPVVEENNLPKGFDYMSGTSSIDGASWASNTDHPTNPLDNGDRDLRWFVDSIDNSGGVTDIQFTIEFQTLFTGVKGTDVNTEYFTNNCNNHSQTNTAYVGWYETSNGYDNNNHAEDDINTSYDFKSPSGTAKIKLRQPCLTISKAAQGNLVEANGSFYYELTINNTGAKSAYDVEISDTLPISITYVNTIIFTVSGSPEYTDTNIGHVAGDSDLSYSIDEIPAGESATIRYFVKVDADVSASLSLINSATVDSYSSQPGTPSDTNGDTKNDERVYAGPTDTQTVYTPGISISKESETGDEFTYGSTIVYTLTVPSSPINAVMYDVSITDQLPAGLQPVSTSAGSFAGNLLTATYDRIDKNTQQIIVIEATVPLTSTLVDGHEFVNVATVTTDQASVVSSQVTDQLTAPALVVEKYSDLFVVSQNDTISYTVVVKNVGLGTAYNIDVSDILPTNQTYLNGEDGLWNIPSLAGGTQQAYSFSTTVISATQGVGYTNRVFAVGDDIEGNDILADSSGRVPSDTDPLDLGRATVYAGPLICNSEIKNVAFEDLKNVGWSDWDYNDLIVKVQTELCFTPPTRMVHNVNACEDVSLEAESAVLSGFTAVADAGASGGQYIHIPDDTEDLVAKDPDSANSATFTFNVAVPGKYKFTGVAEGLNVFADSFWFEIDGGTPIEWKVPRDSGLIDDDVADFANGIDPYTWELSAGDHTVTVYNREDGAKLDKLSLVCQDNMEVFVADSLATVTVTYTTGARGAAFNHQLKHTLDVEGGGQSHWRLFDSNDAVLNNERGGFGDVADFTIFPDTHEAIPPYFPESWKQQTNTHTDQTEYTEGYWSVLAISLNDAASNPSLGLQELPWDVYLPVKDTGEEVHLLVPGHLDNTQTVLDNFDATSPLLGQSLPLGFTFEEGWNWPHEFKGVWNAYPEFVDFIESGRADYLDWYESEKAVEPNLWANYYAGPTLPFDVQAVEINSRYQGSPVVIDLDNDGNNEIILGDMLANKVTVFNGSKSVQWFANTGGGIRGSVAVGNLDSDSELEVVAVSEDGMLYGWNHDGSDLSGYPVQIIEGRLISTPALEDIDNDGELEILIAATNNRLYAREADGTAKWNVSIGDVADTFGSQSLNSSPTIADIDNDNDFEIVVGSFDNCMYAFDHEGTQLWKFCTGDIIVSTPAVAEFGPDAAGKEIVFGSGDQFIYVLKANGELYWRRETGWIVQGSPLIVDIDADGFNDVLIGSDDDKLHAYDFDAFTLPGWPQATNGDIYGRPAFADIDADGQDEVLIGSNDTNVYAFEKDGSTSTGNWPQKAEASIKGSVVIADVRDDGEVEVIAADFQGNLHIWGLDGTAGTIYLPFVVR